MGFFLLLNLTNPTVTYVQKGGAIDLQGHLIYHNTKFLKKMFDQEGYSIIFRLGPKNETALPL